MATIEEQLDSKMIEGRLGLFCICLDSESDWYGWLFKLGPDGKWVSLRKALPTEMNLAVHQMQMLQVIQATPKREATHVL